MQEGSAFMLVAIIGVIALVIYLAAFGPGITVALDGFMGTLHR
ncbi:hypothetical protein ACTFR8_22290 [Bacillus cereus group sp. MYBK15-3]|nr:hypothetical protein [Bacillus cereus]